MVKTYDKKWLSVEEQIAQLRSRGMIIEDEESASLHLQNISYYRLSGYWYPYRCRDTNAKNKVNTPLKRTDEFWSGTSFEEVRKLYVFDQKLRALVLEAMDRLEVALRCTISHTLGEHGATSYYDNASLFRPNFSAPASIGKASKRRVEESEWALWKAKGFSLLNRSQEEYAKFARSTYAPPHPIWIVSETWDLGHLTQLLEGVNVGICDEVANHFGFTDGRGFRSAWRTLRPLRNSAAHQCRLWNASFRKIEVKDLHGDGIEPWRDFYYDCAHSNEADQRRTLSRIGLSLLIMAFSLRHTAIDTSWPKRLIQHLKTFPISECGDVQFEKMGFPPFWEHALLGIQK